MTSNPISEDNKLRDYYKSIINNNVIIKEYCYDQLTNKEV